MERLLAWLKKNYRSLLLSFALSLGLWFVVALDKEYSYTMEIPLKITRLAPGLVLKNDVPENVKIRVNANGSTLLWFVFFHSDTRLQLPEVESSMTIEMADYLERFQFGTDKGIEIREVIEPTTIRLEVDRFVQRRLPVTVRSKVTLEPGFLIVESSSEQDSVLISGPKQIVDTMTTVYTERVEKKDVRFPFSQNVRLINSMPEVISLAPQSLSVSFVVEQIVERTVYNIPIKVINVPETILARPTPETISLRVKGAESRVAALKRDEIDVIFDFATSYNRGETEYLMQIDTPAGITWLEASPEKFSLKLIREEQKS